MNIQYQSLRLHWIKKKCHQQIWPCWLSFLFHELEFGTGNAMIIIQWGSKLCQNLEWRNHLAVPRTIQKCITCHILREFQTAFLYGHSFHAWVVSRFPPTIVYGSDGVEKSWLWCFHLYNTILLCHGLQRLFCRKMLVRMGLHSIR